MNRATSVLAGLAGILAVLGGCGGMPRVDVPREVRIPVPTPCVSEKPARPPFRSPADLDALDDYTYTLAMEAERIKAAGYILELETVVTGCSQIGTGK